MTKKMLKRVTVIDPPEGWKYGFPKPLPDYHNKMDFSLGDWLRSQGYPSKLIPLALKHSRYWEADV